MYPVRQNALVGNFSVSKYYVGEDPFLNYTGNNAISGSINFYNESREHKSFGFS